MIKISDISPLLFNVKSSEFELPVDYIQKFLKSDGDILIQSVMTPGLSLEMAIYDLESNFLLKTIQPIVYEINDYNSLYEFIISLDRGIYKAIIKNDKESIESIPFCIYEDVNNLRETLLIEYTNINNITSFGSVFSVNGDKREFKLRIEGGFKSNDHVLLVSNEQFRTQKQEIIELYSVPYEQSKLTIGDNEGVPFEMARLINNIFCLSSVRINGTRYIRSEESSPEQQLISEDYPQFNYTITLEAAENISYNGFTEYPDGSWSEGGANIHIKNAKDGEVLVYDEVEGGFINRSKLESI